MQDTSFPVLLSVSGIMKHENPSDPVHLVTTGFLTVMPSGYQLTYREILPETNESQDVSLLLDNKRVTMTREGDFSTSLIFEKGRFFESIYHTPFGDMDMSVYASKVNSQLSEDQGEVQLQYHIDLQGHYATEHSLNIKYRKQQAMHH